MIIRALPSSRLAEISGYSAASIPACMSEIRRKWGITVRKSRIWNTYSVSVSNSRFLEIQAQVQSGTPVGGVRSAATMPSVPAGDTALRGLSAGVVSYYRGACCGACVVIYRFFHWDIRAANHREFVERLWIDSLTNAPSVRVHMEEVAERGL
jgi:hypothetical protein